MPDPKVTLRNLALDHEMQGTRFEARDAWLGPRLGLTMIGASYTELPPGGIAVPFHSHRCEDELFVILEGAGTYRHGEARIPFSAGDILAAPAGGPETAHHIVNTGDAVLRYLSISNKAPADVIDYPDSGKRLVKVAGEPPFRSMQRPGPELDYWDGEDTEVG